VRRKRMDGVFGLAMRNALHVMGGGVEIDKVRCIRGGNIPKVGIVERESCNL
jgi:hypothetical protein